MSSLRRKLIPHGLGLKIALWFASLFTVCSVLCLVLAYVYVAKTMREHDREVIVAKSENLSAYIVGEDVSALIKEIDRLDDGDEAEFYVKVTSADGRLLYIDNTFDDLEEFPHVPAPGAAGERFAYGYWNRIFSLEEDEYLELYTVQLPSGVWLEVGHSDEDREEVLTNFRAQLPWVAVALFLGGIFAGLFFTNRALSPIRELIQTVVEIKAGHISARVPISNSRDELDRLKALFNEMLDQVERLIDGMRRTNDNLAHDIKTPISRLRTDAELALRKSEPEDMREALITTIENSDQIVGLVDALMDVAEAEAKSLHLKMEPVNVVQLLSSVCELYQFAAEDAGVTLEHRVHADAGSLTVNGDVVQLRRVIANLIDNAIKYTDAPGRITVTSWMRGQMVRVEVADTGCGISVSDMPHIWSRLFRGDQSRTKRGMGIGLSLVKAIVELHGGRVFVESRHGEGSTFAVELPKAYSVSK